MIAGIDWDTRKIVLCALPWELDSSTPPTYRVEPITQGSAPFRMFQAGISTSTLLRGLSIDSLAIEEPAGRAQIHLRPIYGAICAIAGRHTPVVTTLKATEWRRILGLPMAKQLAHAELAATHPTWCKGRTGDELDAFGIALAWRAEQWRYHAA